jgi:hypothetical protein
MLVYMQMLWKIDGRLSFEFEAIWPLRTFESFIEDCRTGFAATKSA